VWDNVIEKIEHWLAIWRRIYLVKGGSFTLIKNTLCN
jgi:hypothetical protein